MFAMMIVLLSGAAMFGVVSMADGAAEPETDDAPELDTQSGGEGSSPLDEATAETAGGTSGEAEPETETEADTEAETEADTDTETDTETAGTDGEDEAGEDTSENDTITGAEQDDTLDGGLGDDVVSGGAGADTLSGGAGIDQVDGGEGNDVLYGGEPGGGDDGAADSLLGGAGDDTIFLENNDIATGGEGADTFTRAASLTARTLITDFDAAEDLVVVEHESDTPPSLETQRIASDGVILEFSDGSSIELAGLTEALDESLISFVDTRG